VTRRKVLGLPIRLFKQANEWAAWLGKHHAKAPGLRLRLAKKQAKWSSISYAEALDVALRYGWIDGQGQSYDEESWLLKFTSRGPRSIWSKRNRQRALALIKSGADQIWQDEAVRPPGGEEGKATRALAGGV
jgi:uncharacterized protein YdeI (YjbR/CyaY-like superfamily)